MGKNVTTISVKTFYYIIDQVITLLGFIRLHFQSSTHFITFSGVIMFSGNY